MAKKNKYLADLGVFGFDAYEPAIFASLVTEDPLLLIGQSGTGKTFLLNTLSEVLDLEHRHYNASLISFDDLVGFPYPDAENGGVKFLETPATVWGAESVLIDEISRCKPEHQNRLFALVHERKVQGIPLLKLRYRWAAMNPCTTDQGGLEDYTGSEPLDPALADRFALFIWAVDWENLSDDERLKVATPDGEGKTATDGGDLRKRVEAWRAKFLESVTSCPLPILSYVTMAVTTLNSSGIRISPRRSRLMTRSLLALTIVTEETSKQGFFRILKSSLPHACWGAELKRDVIAAAHNAAWDSAMQDESSWIHAFLATKSLAKKLTILLDKCRNADAGSQSIAQLLASEPRERSAAFAFVTYPAAVQGGLPIGAEGVNDLGKVASPILSVDGEITWQERLSQSNTQHPEVSQIAEVIGKLRGGRRERARQFFSWCLLSKVIPEDFRKLEAEMESCVKILKSKGLT
jgi:MoxR-like ATPase